MLPPLIGYQIKFIIINYICVFFFGRIIFYDTHRKQQQQPIILFRASILKVKSVRAVQPFGVFKVNVDIMSRKILYIHKRFLKRLHYHRPIPTCILRTVIMLMVHRDRIQ